MKLPFIIQPPMTMQELQVYIAANFSASTEIVLSVKQIKRDSITSFIAIVED